MDRYDKRNNNENNNWNENNRLNTSYSANEDGQNGNKKNIPMLEIGNIIVSSTYTSIFWVILVFIVGILILV
jgi:hypothetical protein